MIDDRLALESEIQELNALLADMPQENVIDRKSLEARLQSARALLQKEIEKPQAEKFKLTFKGRPVVGTHGIVAEFGSKAATSFSEAFLAVMAALDDKLVAASGPFPDKEKNQLLITGVAQSSFGFEFELPKVDRQHTQEELFGENPGPWLGVDIMIDLMHRAANGTDDDIAEVVEFIHPRALKKVTDFLSFVHHQGAWCALELRNRYFNFSDTDQLATVISRLADDNIHEDAEELVGEFLGVLPENRTFEFRQHESGSVIRGKIESTLVNPGSINDDFRHKTLLVKFVTVKVGNGRTRYFLPSVNAIRSIQGNI